MVWVRSLIRAYLVVLFRDLAVIVVYTASTGEILVCLRLVLWEMGEFLCSTAPEQRERCFGIADIIIALSGTMGDAIEPPCRVFALIGASCSET